MKKKDETNGDAPVAPEADGTEIITDAEAEGNWERPVAVEKDRNVRAWLVFLGLACLSVALWTPLRALYYKYGYKKAEVVVKRDADTFVAIAYYGVDATVSPGSQDISKAAFAEHLRLLRERGYTPIGLEDVRAFYKEGKLLPRKAILMTFEQSRKSSYFEVRDLLTAHKWKAVMGVVTAPMHVKDAQALLWPYLRNMITMGSWDLAAQSERGFDFIQAGPTAGRTGPFFSTPLWQEDDRRYELPAEFSKRVANDHQKVIREFEREVGFKPVAFFFPYGDYGQYEEQAKVIRVTNIHQVGTHYDLGFVLGQLALNTRSSDPRRLNRLLVNPQWSPVEFVDKLETFWPIEPEQVGGRNIAYGAERWIGEWGDVFVRDAELVLRAIPPVNPVMTVRQAPASATAGAKAWLAGSDTFEDGFLSIRFQLKRGRFGVYLRSTTLGDYIYFSLDDAGRVSVRQRLPDMDELILASDGMTGEITSNHELLICLRDNLFFARLDGKTLFGGRVMLRGQSKAGLVASGVWDPIPGIAEAVVLDTRLVGRRDALVTWSPDVAKDIGYLTTWLNEHGYQFNVLSPPWIDVFQNSPVTFPVWDRKALMLLAKTNSMRIMPQMQIRDASMLLKISPEELVARLIDHQVHGLFVDTSACPPEQVTPLVTWLIKLQAALQERQLSMILKLPLAIETLPSAGSILKLLPDVILAGDFLLPPFGLKDSQVLGITRVVPSASDETLSLYYQLSDMLTLYNEVSPDVKKEELRQKGFDAFTSGDYEGAIRLWGEWAKEDPRNAEPFGLIGDAWLRLNEPAKALDAYQLSLSINPGQMNLAIRHSRLLEQQNRLDESADLLNVYARAFPDTPAVTIAQAQWLDRRRQRSEARAVMKSLVSRHPDNIEARLILQTMLDEPAERYANMQDLLTMGRGSEAHLFGFGRDIFSAELLTIPEASVFFDFVRSTAVNASSKKTTDLYQSFLPLSSRVSENFVANKLSDNWVSFGGFRPTSHGRYELQAGTDMSEAFLRLKKSELLRDGFIEVTLDESAGSFWLYARRSSKSMIRFGYDDEGFIRIQSWYNSDLRTYDSRPWLRPPGIVRLRLEVRGDGAIGYVNDKPMFMTPLAIPPSVCYGWWSIAPFSPELGLARARIARIEAGPLAPTVVLFPKLDNTQMRSALDFVRLNVREMSTVAPVAFTQLPDGTVPPEPEIDLTGYRMFCTFHRLRLMPIVDMAYFSSTIPDYLGELILRHRLAGLVVRVRTMPDAEWFRQVEKMLEKTSANVIVIQQEEYFWPTEEESVGFDAAKESARLKKLFKTEMREIQRGNLLLHPIKTVWQVPAVSYEDWTATLAKGKENREGVEPRLVVVPRRLDTMQKDGLKSAEDVVVNLSLPAAPKEPVPAAEEPAAVLPNRADAVPAALEAEGVTNKVVGQMGVTQRVERVVAGAVSNAVGVVGVGTGQTGRVSASVTPPSQPATDDSVQNSLWQRFRAKISREREEREGKAVTPAP